MGRSTFLYLQRLLDVVVFSAVKMLLSLQAFVADTIIPFTLSDILESFFLCQILIENVISIYVFYAFLGTYYINAHSHLGILGPTSTLNKNWCLFFVKVTIHFNLNINPFSYPADYMMPWFILFLLVTLSSPVSASDVRCKCVCKKENDRKIIIKTSIDFEDCKCQTVVDDAWIGACMSQQCECNYDIRNTYVIKASVIITILCSTAMLLFVTMDKLLWKFIRMPRKVYEWKQTNLDKRNRVYVNRSMLH